jgi:hypothetical protein
MRLGNAIPALPVRSIGPAVDYYVSKFGFDCPHQDTGFAIVVRDDTELHLWESGDEGWRSRATAELSAAGVLHPIDKGSPVNTDFGTREFATVDLDGNLMTFYRRS